MGRWSLSATWKNTPEFRIAQINPAPHHDPDIYAEESVRQKRAVDTRVRC